MYTTVITKLDTKGKEYAQLIRPLMAKVRDWGDGKDKDAMLSLETSVFQEYFDLIDDLKERLGFVTELDRLKARSAMLAKFMDMFRDIGGVVSDETDCGTFADRVNQIYDEYKPVFDEALLTDEEKADGK